MKGLKKSELTKIKNILDKSKYLVATWTASDFIKTLNPEKIISSICKHIVDLNVSSRAACMPISGVLADATSSQVLTWMTGFPSRIKHIDGTFKHDRNAFDSQKLIGEKNVDVVIHVSTINSEKLKISEIKSKLRRKKDLVFELNVFIINVFINFYINYVFRRVRINSNNEFLIINS